jgi:filamentous hemagglutinin family protein
MVDLIRRYASMGLVVWTIAVSSQAVQAQVIPDGTLPTRVGSQNGLDFAIEGGSRSGNNLFHSFSQFSVPTLGSAIFNNATDIQNIFSRVTGGTVSNIDGVIQANGGANLFLLNPSGLLFGPNAKLNIGGSFLGTTASSIKFADGVEFSATNPTPLLTMSVPIGLQMGTSSGSIQVQGGGSSLRHPPSFLGPVTRDPQLRGLQVLPGKTLALIGQNLSLDGGVLIAESGHIALGSLSSGTVHLTNPSPDRWTLKYDASQQLADIQLNRAALVDASGNPGGSIQLQGRRISIQDSSLIFVQHQGPQAAGLITIDADILELSGALSNRDASSVLSENLGSTAGGDINVSARQIVARDGGKLITTTFQNGGSGGNITVKAADSIDITGYSPFSASELSGISTPSNTGGGQGGKIVVNAPTISIKDGGSIGAVVLGGSGGGTIQLRAENITLIGENVGTAGASFIGASTFKGGDAGSIDIQTGRLRLNAGGLISASTSGTGNAGSLTIQAREMIDIDGSGSVVAQPSRITASGQKPPGRFQQIFGLSPLPSGNGGNLSITSPMIQVRNQGYIAAENVGSGNAGKLALSANTIRLDQQGQIRTATTVGQGGILALNVRDVLLLRRNSLISAKAGGLGNGGNIEINSPTILGLENSDIIASAVQGKGGNIQITTGGILGLKYRDRLTAENDITASSEFGVNGTVQVNTIGVNPNSGLTTLPVDIVDPSQKIATGCTDQTTSSFIATGRGGIPKNPTQTMNVDRVWPDLRDVVVAGATKPVKLAIAPSQLVEATAWQINPQGQPELIDQGMGSMPKGDRVSCAR